MTPTPRSTPTITPTPTPGIVYGRYSKVNVEASAVAQSYNGDEERDEDEISQHNLGDWESRPLDVSASDSSGGVAFSSSAQAQMSYDMDWDAAGQIYAMTMTARIDANAAGSPQDGHSDARGRTRFELSLRPSHISSECEYEMQGLVSLGSGWVNVSLASSPPALFYLYVATDGLQQIPIQENGVMESSSYSFLIDLLAQASTFSPPVPVGWCQLDLYMQIKPRETTVYHWTGEGQSIDWADGDNWDQDRAPTAGADTVFDLPGVHTIYLNEGSTAYSAHIADGTVIFNGWELILNNRNAGEYSLAIDDGAHLKWEDGELSTYSTGIGLQTPGTMLFEATGTWQNRGPRLDIGVNSPGQLKVNGGTVTTPAGGSDTTVGSRSEARLYVTGDGTFTTESLVIGEQDGSLGRLYVNGDGAWLDSCNTTGNRFVVGSQGFGLLSVDNEAVVEAGELCMGEDTYGIGVVYVENDAHLTLTSDDDRKITVGKQGKGTLDIRYGGSLSVMDASTALTVAEGPSSVGIVTVGLFGELDTGHMTLGIEGAAEMNIEHGEAFCRSAEVAPWDTASLEAEVWVKDEGRWHIDNDLAIGGNGMGALVYVATDGRIEAGRLLIDVFGTLSLLPGGNPWVKAQQTIIRTNGNLMAWVGTLEGFVLLNGGTLYVSPSAVHIPKGSGAGIAAATDSGGLTIRGDLIQSATGTLVIEVGPSGAGILSVTGDVTLDGILDLRFVDGYAPGANDVLTLIACDSALSAGLSEVWISGLQDGFEYALDTEGGSLELTAINDGEALTPGDMNSDEALDYRDLFLFAAHWQELRTTANLNCNLTRGDSTIDEQDLLMLLHRLLK